jgi:hypothetical protein
VLPMRMTRESSGSFRVSWGIGNGTDNFAQ